MWPVASFRSITALALTLAHSAFAADVGRATFCQGPLSELGVAGLSGQQTNLDQQAMPFGEPSADGASHSFAERAHRNQVSVVGTSDFSRNGARLFVAGGALALSDARPGVAVVRGRLDRVAGAAFIAFSPHWIREHSIESIADEFRRLALDSQLEFNERTLDFLRLFKDDDLAALEAVSVAFNQVIASAHPSEAMHRIIERGSPSLLLQRPSVGSGPFLILIPTLRQGVHVSGEGRSEGRSEEDIVFDDLLALSDMLRGDKPLPAGAAEASYLMRLMGSLGQEHYLSMALDLVIPDDLTAWIDIHGDASVGAPAAEPFSWIATALLGGWKARDLAVASRSAQPANEEINEELQSQSQELEADPADDKKGSSAAEATLWEDLLSHVPVERRPYFLEHFHILKAVWKELGGKKAEGKKHRKALVPQVLRIFNEDPSLNLDRMQAVRNMVVYRIPYTVKGDDMRLIYLQGREGHIYILQYGNRREVYDSDHSLRVRANAAAQHLEELLSPPRGHPNR